MSIAGAGDDQPRTRRTPEDRALRASRLTGGPALGHPSTRRETAARLWGSVALVVVSLILLAVFAEQVDRSVGAADALRADGVRVAGTVSGTDGGDRLMGDHVTVAYLADGVERSGIVTLDDVAPDYADGDAVTVFYDPADPARMSIDDQDDENWFSVHVTVLSLLVGAVGLPVGPVSAVRWWWVRRRLARARFEPADARAVQGRHKRVTVHVRVAGEDVVPRRAVLLPPGIWREVSALADWDDGPCWVARSRGRRWVLAAPGGSSPWRMTTARPGRQAERWARQDAGLP